MADDLPIGSPASIDQAIDIPRLDPISHDAGAADWKKAGGGFRVNVLLPVTSPLNPQTAISDAAPLALLPRKEFCASARLGWDDAGLLVLVDVTGRDWHEADKIDQLWNGDSVELYLAPQVGARDLCQWIIAPGMDPAFPHARIHLHDHRSSPELVKNPTEASFECERINTGFQLEARLPWQALGIDPRLGCEVGFQIVVNGHSRGRQAQPNLLWYPMLHTAFDTRRMVALRLATQTHPAIDVRALPRLDHRAQKTEFQVIAPSSFAGKRVSIKSTLGVMATGQLKSDPSGYARASLIGPDTSEPAGFLEVGNEPIESVPLELPVSPGLSRDWMIETQFHMEKSPKLKFVLTLPPTARPEYRVSRREPGQPWQVLGDQISPGEFSDEGVAKGRLYEYAIGHPGTQAAENYFCAGSEVPLRDQRGTALLLVEEAQATPLAAEILRLMRDLVGEGWQVVRHNVAASLTPIEVKKLIQREYAQAPTALNTVFLLGHIPVPYSGNMTPDEHPDHLGAWPADVYYGALVGTWTDESVNHEIDGRQRNVPGDGKFDQNVIPGPVQLAVGRVDFHDMPAFGGDETSLLRRYLDRDHAYRQDSLPVSTRAFVQDAFQDRDERFAYSGWENFSALLGAENVHNATWPNIKPGMNLWFYGCGPGGPQSMANFGYTETLAKYPLEAVFTFLFGSYFGDWDTPDNLMRAALATDGGALTCVWAGRPHWYVHPMGFGATIGDCLRLTQNNDAVGYQPTGTFARGVHIALMGDPTLCMHRIAPPSALRLRESPQGIHLSWTAAPQAVIGYHVYRAATEFGPYARLTDQPVIRCEFTDTPGLPQDHYLIRAVALQSTRTGSYYLASPGVFVDRSISFKIAP